MRDVPESENPYADGEEHRLTRVRQLEEQERLEKQIAAQEAGDAEAAKAAACIDTGSGYPPHVVDTPFPPEAAEEEAYHRESCTHSEDVPAANHPLFEEGMTFHVFRMNTGEWVMTQGRVTQSDGAAALVFYKPYMFVLAQDQQQNLRLRVQPWPVIAGEIYPENISVSGFWGYPGQPVDLFGEYVKLISNVQKATQKDVRKAAQQARQVQRILTPGR